MKLNIDQIAECFELRERGVYVSNLAQIFGVHEATLRKYLRLAELYGFSLWSSKDDIEDQRNCVRACRKSAA